MCLYPRIIQNKKYTKTKKNGGKIPQVEDMRVLAVPIGCGKCMECMKKKGREWQVRLLEDIRHEKDGIFVTLTFSDESIKEINEILTKENDGKELRGYERDNAIAKKATRLFLERWRKKYKKSLRHWLVTELGHQGTKNIHMHGIVWTSVENARKEIEKIWNYGFTWTNDESEGYVNEKTVNYITKYLAKQDKENEYYIPIVLTSPRHREGIYKETRCEQEQIQAWRYKGELRNEDGTRNEPTNILEEQAIQRRRKGKTMDRKTGQGRKMGKWGKNIYKRWIRPLLERIAGSKKKSTKTGV